MGTMYVHTLGDSTLDNVYWMINSEGNNIQEAEGDSVEGQLQACLNSEGGSYTVVSQAYDGFTTESVLNGDYIGRVLPTYPYPEQKQGYFESKNVFSPSERFVRPLNKLKESVSQHPEAIHYVIMSVGGNDFRERLYNPIGMLLEIPNIHERYLRIVNELQNIKERDIRPILMFQYRTDAKNDPYGIYTVLKIVGILATIIHVLCIATVAVAGIAAIAGKINAWVGFAFVAIGGIFLALATQIIPLKVTANILYGQEIGMAALGGLMETFYQPILARAKKEGIPILDLPNTFNPYKKLYKSGIEPNKDGGTLIAEGLRYIIKNHDFSSKKSMVYSKKDSEAEYTASENPGPGGWQVV